LRRSFKIETKWGQAAADVGEPSSSISIPILKALTAFATILKTLTAFAIFKALASLLALTAYKTLPKSAAIAALIETGTVPAVQVKA